MASELLEAPLRVSLSAVDGFEQLVDGPGVGAPGGRDLTSWPLPMIEAVGEMRSSLKRAHSW
ncbi:MAG: hypothetical protein ACXVHX_39190 [Solirubrobacteraceae bacterium]